jgi:hypothetical protein
MFTWIGHTWHSFEAWVAGWLPGLKTEIVALLGMIGSAAAMGQEYLTGLPNSTFVTGTQMAAASLICFTLAFWLRNIGTRAATAQ